MNTKNIFTKTNLLIAFLIVALTLLAIVFFNRAHERPEFVLDSQKEDVKGQQGHLDTAREEIRFTTRDEDEIQMQIDELMEIRN